MIVSKRKFSQLALPAIWVAALAWTYCALGQEPDVVPAKVLELPENPDELAQRLVELSRARFDRQYRTFGVQEVVDLLELAHRLRMIAAGIEGDTDAQLIAAQDLHLQLQRISAAMDLRCQGATEPIVDRELARYRVLVAAALVAKHVGDKTAKIECRKNAVAVAGKLLRAVALAHDAGVLPPVDMFKLSWHHCEARIALINLTIPEAGEATNARIAALDELLKLADTALETERIRYQAGLASYTEFESVLVQQERIAARLADERGNHEEELAAVRRIMDVYASRVRRCHQLHAVNQSCQSELDTVEKQFKDTQAELIEIQQRQAAEKAGGEDAHVLRIAIATTRQRMLSAELAGADKTLARLKHLYSVGGCHALDVVEADARARLASMLLKQCNLDRMELQKKRDESVQSN